MRLSDRFLLWFVFLLPKRLVYWCVIRVLAHSTHKHPHLQPDEVFATDALEDWGDA